MHDKANDNDRNNESNVQLVETAHVQETRHRYTLGFGGLLGVYLITSATYRILNPCGAPTAMLP